MSDDPFALDYAEDVELHTPSEAAQSRAIELARQQLELERQVRSLEDALQEKKRALEEVRTRALPDALTDAGVLELTLRDGARVSVETKVVGYVRKADEPEFYAELEKTPEAALIKRTVGVSLGRGSADLAEGVLEALKRWIGSRDAKLLNTRTVHPQTFQKYVRDAVAGGRALPPQVTVTQLRTATIELPKGTETC